MSQENSHKLFSSWRMYIPIVIGLTVSVWLLYAGFSQTTFVEVEPGLGTHKWVDANQNGLVDLSVEAEFMATGSGSYRLMKWSDLGALFGNDSQFWYWMLCAVVCMFGRDFFYLLRIRILSDQELSWRQSLRVILLWEYASALSPGTVGGTGVAMFILQREKISLGRATAMIIITALMDNLFYLLFIPIVLLFIHDSSWLADLGIHWEFTFWLGYGLIAIACAFLFGSIFLFPQLPKKFFGWLFRLKWVKNWRDQALKIGSDVELTSKSMRAKPMIYWVKVFAATCGSWLSRFLVINAVLVSTVALDWSDHIMVMCKQFVLWLLMLVSPTPGASGVAEYAFNELMAGFGTAAITISALALLWRLISYFPYLFIGSFLLPRWLKKTRKL